ncbi:MAG: tyrosine transporter [Chlamydiae bacterium]|nr:tyrosine transporter [Chlamydiota bacterium]
MSAVTQIFRTISLRKGSVFGAILLLAGSCIGVGMLALPILTGFAGTFPTLLVFTLSWLYMTATALLLSEALLARPTCTNLISLSASVLGASGKSIAWGTFLSLFFSLVIAYVAKGGELVQQALILMFPTLPSWSGAALLSFGSALFIYFGTWAVDHFNRICMYLLLLALAYLLGKGFTGIETKHTIHTDWSYFLFIVPFIITSFGFHNMIPTLNTYLNGSKSKLASSILIGGLITFIIYILWTISIQSVLPLQGEISIEASFRNGEIATEPLIRLVQAPFMQLAAITLTFFAILTSLLAQALSLIDFLADGLSIAKGTKGRIFLCLIVFLPAFFFSQMFPGIFFLALEFVGGIAAMIIFGILPALLVWKQRYRLKESIQPILPGGKIFLLGIIAFATTVILYEIIKHCR